MRVNLKKKKGKLSWCSKWVWKSLFCCCRVMCAVHIWLDAVGLVFFFLLNLSCILNSVDYCLSFQFSFLLHLFWGTVVRYANVWGSWCPHSLFGDELAYFILINILVNIWDSVCRRLNSEGTVLGGSFFLPLPSPCWLHSFMEVNFPLLIRRCFVTVT